MQNNVTAGPILRRTAGADLSEKENFIVMLDSSDEVVLHDGSLANAYVLIDAAGDGEEVGILSLVGLDAVRVKSAAAHDAAAPVYLDIATGKGSAAQSKIRLGFAEESKLVGEGNILIRPAVEIAPVGTLAALAQTISGTYSQSEVQAISTKVDDIIAALKLAR